MFNLVCAVFIVLFAVKRLRAVVKARIVYDKRLPRIFTIIQPISIPGAFLPRTIFHRGFHFLWDERSITYKDADMKTIVIVPALYGPSAIVTASLPVFRQCLSLNTPFEKPDLGILKIMGDNILTTNGESWKRHRRITAPAFNHSTYKNVWEATARVYDDMIKQEGWLHVDETTPAEFNKITHKLTLFLLAIVGFGIPMSWYEPPRGEHGGLSVQSMIFEVSSSVLERWQTPKWAYFLGFKKLRDIDEAYTAFELFMRKRIAEREGHLRKIHETDGRTDADVPESIEDVFGRLVNARFSDGKLNLSDEEIIGNCFIFTLAGHETAANTLAATLALLASNPETQEWVYNSIKAVIGDGAPSFEDFDALTGVLACFYEALRMYPAVFILPRTASKDLTLSIPRTDNPAIVEQLFVRKNTEIYLDLVGMSYDPQTFAEPDIFKPERWIRSGMFSGSTLTMKDREEDEVSGSSPASTLEGFAGFSFGPRTCLGHKFAKVEAVAFLTHLLRDWRVEPGLMGGETVEQWKERVLQPRVKVTLALKEVQLRLVRRR